MEVCNLPATYFVQWQPAHLSHTGEEVFDVVCIERNRMWFEENKDALYEFWKDLMAARAAYIPPPPPITSICDSLYDDDQEY